MARDPKSMTDHELLAELVTLQRRAALMNWIRFAALALLLVLMIVVLCIFVPRIIAPIRQLSESIGQIQQSVSGAKSFFDGLSSDTVTSLEAALESLNETSEKLNGLLDGLGDGGLRDLPNAISNLNNILERLSSLFRLG